jgi:ribosomal protein L25 (general stress protein Ctc)
LKCQKEINQLKLEVMEIIDYVKRGSKENTGAIIINVYGGKTEYIAVTVTTSKTYKTLKGAEKMMKFFEYDKI